MGVDVVSAEARAFDEYPRADTNAHVRPDHALLWQHGSEGIGEITTERSNDITKERLNDRRLDDSTDRSVAGRFFVPSFLRSSSLVPSFGFFVPSFLRSVVTTSLHRKTRSRSFLLSSSDTTASLRHRDVARAVLPLAGIVRKHHSRRPSCKPGRDQRSRVCARAVRQWRRSPRARMH